MIKELISYSNKSLLMTIIDDFFAFSVKSVNF